MVRVPLVIHERRGVWARQMRPRAIGWPVRLVETRSAADLTAALALSACPVVLIDLGERVRSGLEDLDRAMVTAPHALVLVLDPRAHPAVAHLARELGASHVIAGVVPPPVVVDLIGRWANLAHKRAEADGFSQDIEPESQPWEPGWAPSRPLVAAPATPLND